MSGRRNFDFGVRVWHFELQLFCGDLNITNLVLLFEWVTTAISGLRCTCLQGVFQNVASYPPF
jgi:hypothetical protein